MVHKNKFDGLKLSQSIEDAVVHINACQRCGFITEDQFCQICLDEFRDGQKLCIVQDSKDIFTIEQCHIFDGRYFVVDCIEKPLINRLISLIEKENIVEILFAVSPSIANDSFILFIEDKLEKFDIKFNKIAQGVPTGVSLENVDMLSLAKAIDGKTKV